MKTLLFFLILIFVTPSQAQLNVYASDGTTLIGKYVGCRGYCPADSPSIMMTLFYADKTTSVIKRIGEVTAGSNINAAKGTLYYSGASCTGSVVGGATSGNINLCDGYNCANTNGVGGGAYVSYRAFGGACTTASGTAPYAVTATVVDPCNGNCVIKP